MHKTVLEIKRLRQKIEAAQAETGNTADYIDRGKPNPEELKTAQEFIANKDKEIKELMMEFNALLAAMPKEAIYEWVNWHKEILQNILAENGANKTRLFVAKQALEEWEQIAAGNHKHIHINGHFLKDYKEKVIQETA